MDENQKTLMALAFYMLPPQDRADMGKVAEQMKKLELLFISPQVIGQLGLMAEQMKNLFQYAEATRQALLLTNKELGKRIASLEAGLGVTPPPASTPTGVEVIKHG